MSVVPRFLWDPKLVEMIEEAFERIQISPSTVTGEQLQSALRSLRLLLIEWSTDLSQTWTVENQEFPLVRGQASITLPVGALAVAEAWYREPASGTDTRVYIMSRDKWTMIPDKTIVGDRPTYIWVDKKHPIGAPRQYEAMLWQRPGKAASLFVNLIMTVQDPGGVGDAPEVPQTWFDALAAGLAHALSRKFRPERTRDLLFDKRESYALATGSTADRGNIELVFPKRRRNG